MAKPRIHAVDYFDFQVALRKAIDTGHRIDKTDKERWGEYVRKNSVPEAAMAKRGAGLLVGGRAEVVIINDNGEWEGYYVYSTLDQACLKFDVRGD